jgi:hypothetical protein
MRLETEVEYPCGLKYKFYLESWSGIGKVTDTIEPCPLHGKDCRNADS